MFRVDTQTQLTQTQAKLQKLKQEYENYLIKKQKELKEIIRSIIEKYQNDERIKKIAIFTRGSETRASQDMVGQLHLLLAKEVVEPQEIIETLKTCKRILKTHDIELTFQIYIDPLEQYDTTLKKLKTKITTAEQELEELSQTILKEDFIKDLETVGNLYKEQYKKGLTSLNITRISFIKDYLTSNFVNITLDKFVKYIEAQYPLPLYQDEQFNELVKIFNTILITFIAKRDPKEPIKKAKFANRQRDEGRKNVETLEPQEPQKLPNQVTTAKGKFIAYIEAHQQDAFYQKWNDAKEGISDRILYRIALTKYNSLDTYSSALIQSKGANTWYSPKTFFPVTWFSSEAKVLKEFIDSYRETFIPLSSQLEVMQKKWAHELLDYAQDKEGFFNTSSDKERITLANQLAFDLLACSSADEINERLLKVVLPENSRLTEIIKSMKTDFTNYKNETLTLELKEAQRDNQPAQYYAQLIITKLNNIEASEDEKQSLTKALQTFKDRPNSNLSELGKILADKRNALRTGCNVFATNHLKSYLDACIRNLDTISKAMSTSIFAKNNTKEQQDAKPREKRIELK